MMFLISDPRGWTKFGSVKEATREGNKLSFSNGENTISADFGDACTIEGFEPFEDRKVVSVKPTVMNRVTNEDGTRTMTQKWQVLFSDTTSSFFTVERTYPKYVATVNPITTTMS